MTEPIPTKRPRTTTPAADRIVAGLKNLDTMREVVSKLCAGNEDAARILRDKLTDGLKNLEE